VARGGGGREKQDSRNRKRVPERKGGAGSRRLGEKKSQPEPKERMSSSTSREKGGKPSEFRVRGEEESRRPGAKKCATSTLSKDLTLGLGRKKGCCGQQKRDPGPTGRTYIQAKKDDHSRDTVQKGRENARLILKENPLRSSPGGGESVGRGKDPLSRSWGKKRLPTTGPKKGGKGGRRGTEGKKGRAPPAQRGKRPPVHPRRGKNGPQRRINGKKKTPCKRKKKKGDLKNGGRRSCEERGLKRKRDRPRTLREKRAPGRRPHKKVRKMSMNSLGPGGAGEREKKKVLLLESRDLLAEAREKKKKFMSREAGKPEKGGRSPPRAGRNLAHGSAATGKKKEGTGSVEGV